jgi:hypothetical protein
MGLASIAAHKLGGVVPVGAIFKASIAIGQWRARSRSAASTAVRQTGFSPIPSITPEREPSQPATIQAAETFPHISVDTLPVLQTSDKICLSE